MIRWLHGFLHGAATVAAYFLAFIVDVRFLVIAIPTTLIFLFSMAYIIVEHWDD